MVYIDNVSIWYYTAPSGNMINEQWIGKNVDDNGCGALLQDITQPEGTEENTKKLQSG
jgi:hypothetical protein